jgi:hypothetical protein
MVGEERCPGDDIPIRARDAEGAGRGTGLEGRRGNWNSSGGVPLRGCLGGGRAAAGVGVIDFERTELDAEAGVQSRR